MLQNFQYLEPPLGVIEIDPGKRRIKLHILNQSFLIGSSHCYVRHRLTCPGASFCAIGNILADTDPLPGKSVTTRPRRNLEWASNSPIHYVDAEFRIWKLIGRNRGALRRFNNERPGLYCWRRCLCQFDRFCEREWFGLKGKDGDI